MAERELQEGKPTEGTTTNAAGPSPSITDIFVSISKAAITMGRAKTKVFPDPVKAIPIMSLPNNLNAEGKKI